MSTEIERVVFGTILASADTKYLKSIDTNYFFDPIINEAVNFCATNNTLDVYLLDRHLQSFTQYTGISELNALPKVRINSDEYTTYVQTLKKDYYDNLLQIKLNQTIGSGITTDNLSSIKNIVSSIENGLATGNIKSYRASEFGSSVLDDVLRVSELGGAYSGIPSGIRALDGLLSGFQKQDLVIVGARPSVGKSSLITTIAQNLHTLKPEAVVVIFSLEMSKSQIIQRLLSGLGHIPLQKIRSGNLSLQEWARLIYAKSLLSKCNIYIDDKSAITIEHVYEVLNNIKNHTKNIDLVFIDYLQLMKTQNRFNDKRLEVTELSGSCKTAAKEFDTPFVVLSQLSRSPQQRTDKRPQLSDLRESGSVEQDADVVIMLYRDSQYNKTPDNEYLAELIVAKHRNGPTGTVNVAYIKEFTRFENLIYNN